MNVDRAPAFPPPPSELRAAPDDWLSWSGRLWRVHQHAPDRPAWNELRHWGPAPGNRFEPQAPPPSGDREEGVQYVGLSALTALTETFQQHRLIPVHDGSLWLYGWTVVRPLHLLDVRYEFGAANGAYAGFSAADKSVVRQWARAAHLQWPDMDGIIYNSKVVGGSAVALFTHAERDPVWPANPAFARSLADPAALPLVQAAADRVNWTLDYGV